MEISVRRAHKGHEKKLTLQLRSILITHAGHGTLT